MTVSDNTIQAEILGYFFKILGIKGFDSSKRLTKIYSKNPGRALEIRANLASALASPSLKPASSPLPEVVNFCHTGKRMYLRNSV